MNLLAFPRMGLIAFSLMVLVPFVMPSWLMFVMTKVMFMFITVLGVSIFLQGGLLTFGHALFYATGAYTVGFSVKYLGLRELLVLIPMGVLSGIIMASLVGVVMARYRGVFFAMLNLAFSMILYALLLKFYWVTGGSDGLSAGTATLLGSPLPGSSTGFYYFSLTVACIAAFVVYRFLASPLGFFLKAIGDNEIRIEYSGVSVRKVIYRTYILSGALGSVGGVLAAFTIGHVVPEDSFWIQSGEFVFVSLLGGFGGLPGPLLGALAFEFIQTYASKFFPLAWQMTLGIIMLVIILYQPHGLWGIYKQVVNRFSRGAKGG